MLCLLAAAMELAYLTLMAGVDIRSGIYLPYAGFRQKHRISEDTLIHNDCYERVSTCRFCLPV